MRKWMLLAAMTVCGVTMIAAGQSFGQFNPNFQTSPYAQYNRYNYYPYYYFPHNYWPVTGPKWPEKQGDPYMRPPAYMAYPPYFEPWWRYEAYQPQKYYRGHHFFLDQF
jgi:hypothetical protein